MSINIENKTKIDMQKVHPQIRTKNWQHVDTDSEHPGNLHDPSRPIAPLAIDYLDASIRPWHNHYRGQLVYATKGVMQVETHDGTWVVAPEQAVWVPPQQQHRVGHKTAVLMRTLYIDPSVSTEMPGKCCVIDVSELLKQLIIKSVQIGMDYPSNGKEARFMEVILDELQTLQPVPMHLPKPSDARLKNITNALLENPGDSRTLAQWANNSGASERTLARQFVAQVGMTFGEWRERQRLMEGINKLADGQSVTSIALELGYQSASAFITMFKRNLGTSPASFSRRFD